MSRFKSLILCGAGLFLLTAGAVQAQSVERIYAGNSCKAIAGAEATTGDWLMVFSGDESLDAGDPGSSGVARAVCPIVRQKINSSKGAKFFVYFTSTDWGFGDRVSCTMTSRRPHNGVLVSSGTRQNVNNSSQQQLLARSIAPSSTWGHYSLQCTSNTTFPEIQSYRIKEF